MLTHEHPVGHVGAHVLSSGQLIGGDAAKVPCLHFTSGEKARVLPRSQVHLGICGNNQDVGHWGGVGDNCCTYNLRV